MEPSALYFQIGRTLETMPYLGPGGIGTPEVQQWLGRAYALVELDGNAFDIVEFRTSVAQLTNVALNESAKLRILNCLHRVMARAELKMPIDQQGAFLPTGEAFTALMQVSKAVSGAGVDVLFVDPYADVVLLEKFCVLIPSGVPTRILGDKRNLHSSFRVAAACWSEQFGAARPLNVRMTPKGKLHDRLIVVDGKEVWSVSQSFKNLADRSPASISRFPSDIAKMKIESYEDLWADAMDLSQRDEQ